MENVIAIGAGLALRAVIDILTDDDHRLTGTLVGLWEGIVLSHFLHKNPRNSNDAYLALATRFLIDFMLTNSVVRFALTGAWTLVGLLLADIAPSVWRDTGLKYMYRALRKDFKAMRRTMPRWRIENDIQVPNISISSPVPGLFSRRPPSTIVSSTRAAPPASPAPILQRPPSSASGTLSETNTRTREVLLGPSPALIHIDVDPVFPPSSNQDSHSQRSSLLSNASDSDPSRHDPVSIPDDDLARTTVPPYTQEQEEEQDPDLSVLHLSPPVAAVEVTTTNLEIVSPTPRARIGALPVIPDTEIDLSAHARQVPLPESRPASRVRSIISAIGVGASSQFARARLGEADSDRGPDLGKVHAPFHQRASSAGVSGQAQNHPTSGNRPGSTGHQRSNSRWEHSMIRRPEETIMPAGAAGTEDFIGGFVMQANSQQEPAPRHEETIVPAGAAGTEDFVDGIVIQANRQTPKRSGTPKAQSGSGSVSVRANSALGLSTPLSPSKTPTILPNRKPSSESTPQTKPPTPVPIKGMTFSKTPTPAPPSKTPTPAPPSKTPTPAPPSKPPKSRCTSPGLTSGTNRTSGPNAADATDYDPANPIRPMIRSPATVPDSIFPGPTGQYDPFYTSRDIEDDPPPPFKEFESPVGPPGESFVRDVEADGNGSGSGRVVEDDDAGADPAVAEVGVEEEGQEVAQEEQQGAVTNDNIGNVDDVDGKAADEGTEEQEKSKQDGEGNQGAGMDVQGAGDDSHTRDGDAAVGDASLASGDTQIAGDGTQVAGGDTQVASGDTEDAGGHTEDAGENNENAGGNTENADSSPTPEPVTLTPEQTETEIHRVAFLRKEVARLEASRKKINYSDENGLSENQARLNAVKGRISRTVFADPPECPPPSSEVPTLGRGVPEICSVMTEMVVDLLIERQDAGPIEVMVISSSLWKKPKQAAIERMLKEFFTENKFSIRTDPAIGPLTTVIIV